MLWCSANRIQIFSASMSCICYSQVLAVFKVVESSEIVSCPRSLYVSTIIRSLLGAGTLNNAVEKLGDFPSQDIVNFGCRM
jgi:hypothetical protein